MQYMSLNKNIYVKDIYTLFFGTPYTKLVVRILTMVRLLITLSATSRF